MSPISQLLAMPLLPPAPGVGMMPQDGDGGAGRGHVAGSLSAIHAPGVAELEVPRALALVTAMRWTG
jgi:hypothetical protein